MLADRGRGGDRKNAEQKMGDTKAAVKSGKSSKSVKSNRKEGSARSANKRYKRMSSRLIKARGGFGKK